MTIGPPRASEITPQEQFLAAWERVNPVASTVVERAADLAKGDVHALWNHAQTFAELGYNYQRLRCGHLSPTGSDR